MATPERNTNNIILMMYFDLNQKFFIGKIDTFRIVDDCMLNFSLFAVALIAGIHLSCGDIRPNSDLPRAHMICLCIFLMIDVSARPESTDFICFIGRSVISVFYLKL